jgi:predicted nucleotidyltransferase
MSRFGLNETAIARICGVLSRHPEVDSAKVFGSRALGRHRPESDIDIALWGVIDDVQVGRIIGELDDLPLPQRFDVTDYARLRHEGLKRHIDECGVPLYTKGAAKS